MPATPDVSFILATYNRREVTLRTLDAVFGSRRPNAPFEVTVVDNASTDGTAEAIRSEFPEATLLAESNNLGSCAKALGVDRVTGRYVVFLDDDSYPHAGAIDRMIEHFEARPDLGAAGFRVHLPDGREECSAFANVFIGCGVGFRTDVLRQVGNLDHTFFMQAEEYDLSFRLINAGWRVETFADLHVDHLKTPCARRSGRTVFYDTRNNLIVAARYLPDEWLGAYRRDWLQRYAWLAAADGHTGPYLRGVAAGVRRGLTDRIRHAKLRLSPTAFETLFRLGFVEQRLQALADSGVTRLILADLGKNVFAFWNAARRCRLQVTAIGDDRFAGEDRSYRGVPIVTLEQALETAPDVAVVSNTSPVHARQTTQRLGTMFDGPSCSWFGGGPTPVGRPAGAPESTGVAAAPAPA